MASFRINRLSEDIKREISVLMRDLKDPRIHHGILSIVKVELSNDLSHCKVYISAMEGMEVAKEATKGLQSASGLLRRELSARIRMRRTPELHFIPDDSIEYSAQLNDLFNHLHKDSEEEENV